MRVICVGEMLIDFTPGAEPHSYVANPGGAPANVAVSIARCGGRAGFLGRLGDDDFGRLLLKTLETENVEVLCPKLTGEAVTTLAFVSLDEEGNRSFTFARKPGADILLSKEDVDAVDWEQCSLLHAGSVSQSAEPERSAVLYALAKAKDKGIMVSFDINYRDAIWNREACMEAVNEVLPFVDFLKISEEELSFVGGKENILPFMQRHDITVVILTLGSEGAEIFFQEQSRSLEAMKVSAVDSTGAGDSFFGAFLCRLLEQQVVHTEDITWEKLWGAGRFGICASGLCVQEKGGIPAIPYRKQVEETVYETFGN